MAIKILEETVDALKDYGQVSIAFRVDTRFRVEPVDHGLGGFLLVEEKVEPPYVKDYDSDKGEGPTRWRKRWNIEHWGVLSAFDGDWRVGGVVVAYDTEGVFMLEGRKDLAVVWDIRIHPDYRGCGIGSQLFERAVNWARARRCRHLKVETQNINVPACRFYAKQGCELRAIDRYAYPDYPDEVQLIWYMSIEKK
ncbi:GNAT family N-acetyltransferase [Candidatus Poribacteria bacterium]|nr:GNAT family N-acetyltransferase [Candidatus Poribacteria bacterium]